MTFDEYWTGLGFTIGDNCYHWAKSGWNAALEAAAKKCNDTATTEGLDVGTSSRAIVCLHVAGELRAMRATD